MHGRIVGIDETRIVVQQAVQKLDHLDLLNNVARIYGTTHYLDTINGTLDAGHVQTTFDIISARNSLPPSPLSGRHCFDTGQPTLLFSKDYGHKKNTVADDGFYALLGSVLGKLSMHILYHNKAEIDYQHYLGPQLQIWHCYEYNDLNFPCVLGDECPLLKIAGLLVDV